MKLETKLKIWIVTGIPLEQIQRVLKLDGIDMTMEELTNCKNTYTSSDIDTITANQNSSAILALLQMNLANPLLKELDLYQRNLHASTKEKSLMLRHIQMLFDMYRAASGFEVEVDLNKALFVVDKFGYEVSKKENDSSEEK